MVGKGNNVIYQHFFLFLQCFQKLSFLTIIFFSNNNCFKSLLRVMMVVLGFNSYGHMMEVGDANVFPGFLTSVPTRLSFQSH